MAHDPFTPFGAAFMNKTIILHTSTYIHIS